MISPLEAIGTAILYHIKKGVPVTHVRVWLTHANVHAIWDGNNAQSKKLRATYPLEISLAVLGKEPQVIDCRKFTAPWDITLPPPKRPAPVMYPPDTGDPVKDFHPPRVEPLVILDDVSTESEIPPSPAGSP